MSSNSLSLIGLDISHRKVSDIIFYHSRVTFLRETSLYSDVSSPGLKNNSKVPSPVFSTLFPISPLLIQKTIKILGCTLDFNKIIINVVIRLEKISRRKNLQSNLILTGGDDDISHDCGMIRSVLPISNRTIQLITNERSSSYFSLYCHHIRKGLILKLNSLVHPHHY